MKFTELADDPEDAQHSPAERVSRRLAQHLGQRRRSTSS